MITIPIPYNHHDPDRDPNVSPSHLINLPKKEEREIKRSNIQHSDRVILSSERTSTVVGSVF
jgi:hypothetical protein